MRKVTWMALALSPPLLMAGGYKIPEVSLKGTALSAACIANAYGADASYYNPAYMAFSGENRAFEADLTYIGLSKIRFEGSAPAPDGSMDSSGATSEAETFLVPSLHYRSEALGDFRYGLSVVVPGGLSKRWEEQPARTYAHEFTLEVIELNPTLSYRLSETLALGIGLRAIYSSGIVKSASLASRDMEGDSFDFGYNLALAYKPTSELSLALTYRSNVDLSEEGTANLYFPDNGNYQGSLHYSGNTEVTVPLPATFNVAAAYGFGNGTTLELVYERIFWSSYEELDFNYAANIGPLASRFDEPVKKGWSDTSTYRMGLTHKMDKTTVMAAVAYDETPVPEHSLNFELPDSNAWIYSAGFIYDYSEAFSVGAALLYDAKEERSVNGGKNESHINGTFKDASALLITIGGEYRF